MARAVLFVAMLAAPLPACDHEVPGRVLVVQAPPRGDLDLATIQWEPPEAVARASRISPTRVELELAAGASDRISIRAPGACPVDVSPKEIAAGTPGHVELAAWIDLGPDRVQVGYDTAFSLRATRGCREAEGAKIEWRQIEGAPIALSVDPDGAGIRGRTPPFTSAHPEPPVWGIVPISPRTRAAYAFQATVVGASSAARGTVRVAAAARASGLPTLSVGQRVLLGGEGWVIHTAPQASAAALEPLAGGLTAFQPDATGRWVLTDGAGRELSLSAGQHDRMPLDCGRSECHVGATAGAVQSPMTHVLRRGLGGELGREHDPACAIACHATGEPGLSDGFTAVAEQLGVPVPHHAAPGSWEALPAPLQRLGGVGCTACHGPSSLPEPGARIGILRTDTCAVCHDAPPRYGHVSAWRGSRMARSDATPGTEAPGCARCHTTAGFLAAIGSRPLRREPDSAHEPIGITCAACHAAHAESGPALLRKIAAPESIAQPAAPLDAESPSWVCLACHAPVVGDGVPAATAAAIWLGRGALDIDSGAPWTPGKSAPHATVAEGCVGCHAAPPRGLHVERGARHGFRADPVRCTPCHAGAVGQERPGPDGKLVAARAAELWERFANATPAASELRIAVGSPVHARARSLPAAGTREGRIAHNLLLVLEDPAAAAHNAPFARALLDDVERALQSRH